MCKIHHAANDSDIVGVRPDGVAEVRHDVLEETDGPMLRHGLQRCMGEAVAAPVAGEAAVGGGVGAAMGEVSGGGVRSVRCRLYVAPKSVADNHDRKGPRPDGRNSIWRRVRI